jgi:hypothetical protein
MNTQTEIDRGVRERLLALAATVTVTGNSANGIMKHYGAIVAKNARIPLTNSTAAEKGELAREAAAIFAADISRNPVILDMSMNQAIKAADFTDPHGSLGLLSGTLVMQKALPMLIGQNPLLKSISTDFSDEPGVFNQTSTTRIVLKPSVQSYDPTPDAGGRPKGWTTTSPAQTIDVPVVLDSYLGVPLVFGAATLGSTTRRLFDESAPLAVAALADEAVGKLSALMIPANFNAYKGTSVTGGATTSGSKSITFTSSSNLYPGQAISGTGIPTGTRIASVESATAATLTQKATATGSSLTFSLSAGKVPSAYTTYVKALAEWGVVDLDNLGGVFDLNDLPMTGRFAALTSTYYRKLGSDASINALMQATGDPTYLTERRLPNISGFELLNSPWLSPTSNRTGFAGHKASLVLKTRLPNDLSAVIGDGPGAGGVTTMVDPGSGLSILLVQYVNRQANYAEWRPEIMMGAAVGDRRGGLVITSE